MFEFIAETFGFIVFAGSVLWLLFIIWTLNDVDLDLNEFTVTSLIVTGFSVGSVFWFLLDLID